MKNLLMDLLRTSDSYLRLRNPSLHRILDFLSIFMHSEIALVETAKIAEVMTKNGRISQKCLDAKETMDFKKNEIFSFSSHSLEW